MRTQLLSRFNARVFISIGFTLVGLTGIVIFPHWSAAAQPVTGTPTTTPLPVTAPTVIAEQGTAQWDYVFLGDSVTFQYPKYYAEMLEEDLGVTIHIIDEASSGLHSSTLLMQLQTNEKLREAIQNAEIITIEIPMAVFNAPMGGLFLRGLDCGGADNQDCIREAMGVFKADTEAIFAELVALRSPSEALIRTHDLYQFYVADTKAAGEFEFEVINSYWREANAYVIEVATEYGIPVALVFDAFMGEAGTDTPPQDLVYDHAHPTRKGARLIAELLSELGYAYAPPRATDPE